MDQCLQNWEKAIDDWSSAAELAAQKETMLKAYEAAKKVALVQGSKMSATMADSTVRATADWEVKYLECQRANIAGERAKRILRLSEAKWETERSKQVSLRQLK
ncbi:MAG: hypothetical protein CBC83_00165 [Flavobacteriales bacterium TMED123]|nr:MAG: hypothetical protein CBC83_00165 [Flavobacteriales bacterium TMED123]|tara:strand:- start:111 stop:422 length:312 start_codon:yes stop_codon:yes gene_type:complete